MNFKIFQYDVGFGTPEESLNKIKRMFAESNLIEDDVIVLPEMWTTGFDLKSLKKLAAIKLEPYLSEVQTLAKKYKVNIIAGSIANKTEESSNDIYNTAFVVDKKGKLIHEYSKIHLVPMLDEPLYLTQGNNTIENFEIADNKFGLAICYDLRFPEIFRDMSMQGAEIIVVVAEWPIERKEHFLTLLKARAIENQCYVVASNVVGIQNNETKFAGSSVIYDPLGNEVVKSTIIEEEVLSANIDINYVNEVRENIPIFKSRRPEKYKFL